MTEWIIVYHDNERNRVNDALCNLSAIEWDHVQQTKNIQTGDTVYLYECETKSIRWKCRVTDVQRENSIIPSAPYFYNEDSENPVMELEPLYEYPFPEQMSLDILKDNGYKGHMQGPFRIKKFPEMEKYIHKIDKEQTSHEELLETIHGLSAQRLEELAKKHSCKNPIMYDVHVKQYQRNIFVAENAKRRAGGYCELCCEEAPFLDKNGKPYLEIHHIEWLSKGGADSIENTVALCPNCHKKMHIIQDVADVSYLKDLAEK